MQNTKHQKGFSLAIVLVLFTAITLACGFILNEQLVYHHQSGLATVTPFAESEARRFSHALRSACWAKWQEVLVDKGDWSAVQPSQIGEYLALLLTDYDYLGVSGNMATFELNRDKYTVSGATVPVIKVELVIPAMSGDANPATLPSLSAPAYAGPFAGLAAHCVTFEFRLIIRFANQVCLDQDILITPAIIPNSAIGLSSSGNLDIDNSLTVSLTTPIVATGSVSGGKSVTAGGVVGGNLDDAKFKLNGSVAADLAAGKNGFNLRGLAKSRTLNVTLESNQASAYADLQRPIKGEWYLLPGLASASGMSGEEIALAKIHQPFYAVPVQNRVTLRLSGVINSTNPLNSIKVIQSQGNEATTGSVPNWLQFNTRQLANTVMLMVSIDLNQVPVTDGKRNLFVSIFDVDQNTYDSTRVRVVLNNNTNLSTGGAVSAMLVTPNPLILNGNINTDSRIPFNLFARRILYSWNSFTDVTVEGGRAALGDSTFRPQSNDGAALQKYVFQERIYSTAIAGGRGDYFAVFVGFKPHR